MRRRLLLALVGGWVALSALAAEDPPIPGHPDRLPLQEKPAAIPQASGRRVDLNNGAVAFLAADSTLPLVEISLALRVGSFLEPFDKTGLALLATSQLRRGGSGELAADAFDNRLDLLGARIETMSGTTRSGVSLSVPSWALDESLDLFLRMLAEPSFEEDRLELARDNLHESLRRRNEDPLEILQREWEWLMYGEDHFTTRPITPATLATIERSDLVRFHRRYWRPERMVLAISGDFDRQELLARIETGLVDLAATDADPGPTIPWPPPAPGPGAEPGLYHYEKDIPQAKVMLGHRFPRLLPWPDRDRLSLAVLAELLGGRGAISRITGRLRTAEGLVYRASVELIPGDLWPGVFEVFFETRGSDVARAIELAVEEIERLRDEPVHPLELEVVKATLMARTQLRFDTAEEIAGYFAEDALLDRPHSFWQDYLDGIASVSAAEVTAVAKEYLQPATLRTLVVGRWSEIGGRDEPGATSLETLLGHPRTALPSRDPLTLEPPPGSP